MHNVNARFAEVTDIPKLAEWLYLNRKKNKFDPEVFQYDSSRIMAMELDGSPAMYQPYQLVIMLEGLAPKPGLTPLETALLLREGLHAVARVAKVSHIDEVYFLSGDEETITFAEAHGFTELKTLKVLRLKVKDMTPPLPDVRSNDEAHLEVKEILE
jgi:hypothetical protein